MKGGREKERETERKQEKNILVYREWNGKWERQTDREVEKRKRLMLGRRERR